MDDITTLFISFLKDINNNNIEGYKNLLFFIFQNFKLDNPLNEQIYSFLQFLFEEGIISQGERKEDKKNYEPKKEDIIKNENKIQNIIKDIIHRKIINETEAFYFNLKK